jgi:hypothetical protein
MPSTPRRDNTLLYTVGGSIAALVIGFGGAWVYLQHHARLRAEPFFSQPVAVVTATSEHSVAATFAIRATGAEAGWVRAHRSAIEQIVKHALSETDLLAAIGPQGLGALQASLRDLVNKKLNTDYVQEVVITDFLVGDTSY